MSQLKEEWKEKLRIKNRRDVWVQGKYGRVTVTTDIYQAPEEIRNDKEMCLIALLESDEFLWNIPYEMINLEFLKEIFEKGYKENILYALSVWKEDYFDFIKEYVSSIGIKNMKYSYFLRKSGVLANRDMVLNLVENKLFDNSDFLLEHYPKDKEIISELLKMKPNLISKVMKSVKNYHCKNFDNIYMILKSNPRNYEFLPEKIKEKDEIIDLALLLDSHNFHNLPEKVLEDKEKIIKLINTHKTISGTDIPYNYKNDFDVAKIIIERNGKDFSYFNFSDEDQLIRLSLINYKYIYNIPNKLEYKDLMFEVLDSAPKENNNNYFKSVSYDKKFDFIKEYIPYLIESNKVDELEISKYLSSNLILKDKDFLIKCMRLLPRIYESFVGLNTHNNIDDEIELAYIYISECENKYPGYEFEDKLSNHIKINARKDNISPKVFVSNEYFKQKLTSRAKGKLHKV